MSANIGGPGERWVRRVNARERSDCIIDSGDDGEKVVSRMKQAIDRRKNSGMCTAFSLAIDATKVAKVLKVSSDHGKYLGERIQNT